MGDYQNMEGHGLTEGTGWLELPLSRGMVALIDAADWQACSAHKWQAGDTGEGRFYARRRDHKAGRHIFLHREIMCAPKGRCVDHVNGNTLDNRRVNLRICTILQNNWNSRTVVGKSGVKGVSWSKSNHRWIAQIRAGGPKIHLGTFRSIEEAAVAYADAAALMHGEFARCSQITSRPVVTIPPNKIPVPGSPPPKLDAVAASQGPRFSDSPDEAAA
jgi:hypothetical protein